MEILDKLKGYRTLIFNALTLIMLIVNFLSGVIDDTTALGVLATINAAGNFGLRFLTKTPVGKSIPPAPETGS